MAQIVSDRSTFQMEAPVSLESHTLTVEGTGEVAELGFMLVTRKGNGGSVGYHVICAN